MPLSEETVLKKTSSGLFGAKLALCFWCTALSLALGLTSVLAQPRTLSLPLENKWSPVLVVPDNRLAGAVPADITSSVNLDRLTLGAGDQIYITVFGQPDMSAEVTVNDNLQVTLPLVGSLKVGALTPPMLERLIAKRLKEGEYLLNPEVSIQVRQVRSQVMSVLGEVQRPGRFVLAGKMTVLDALAMAGGMTPRADQTVVLIRRDASKIGGSSSQEMNLSLKHLLDSRRAELNLELRNDDVLFVAQQKSFYIFGEVRKPGSYPMELDLNVMRVLALSGGVTERGSIKRIRIHRQGQDQKMTEIRPSLSELIEGGDVVFVD
jgi:polysaccharide export outer membrane protein